MATRWLKTYRSAILAPGGEIKRGNTFLEPKAPLTCFGESPPKRAGFFKTGAY